MRAFGFCEHVGVPMDEAPLVVFSSENFRHPQGHGGGSRLSCHADFGVLDADPVAKFAALAALQYFQLGRASGKEVRGAFSVRFIDGRTAFHVTAYRRKKRRFR